METPFGACAKIIGDEVPVDCGANPRRVDILAREHKSGHYLVIEVKRAEATSAAIAQLGHYLKGLSRREDYSDSSLRGILVAERIPARVIAEAEAAGVAAYEVEYPLTFRKMTSSMREFA